VEQDWIGLNFIGQDWTRTETFHSPLISERRLDDEMDADFAHLT